MATIIPFREGEESLSIDEVRAIKGCENLSMDEAKAVINTLEAFAMLILKNLPKLGTTIDNQDVIHLNQQRKAA